MRATTGGFRTLDRFGDPLVCTPRDAVRSFYSSGIDTLFVGPFMLEK